MEAELDETNKCDIRGAGRSYHVEYRFNETDGYETTNLTHDREPRSDDLPDDEIEVGWVAEPDESPGLAMVQLFEGEELATHIMHRLSVTTLLQLSDMFRTVAFRIHEEQLEADAKAIADQLEWDATHPPLPFV